MSENKHTPEPWRFAWQNNNELQMSFACVVIGDNIVVIGHGAEAEANARRIVSCVNACAGISTDALESEGSAVMGWNRTASKLIRTTKQRDELLSIFRLVISEMEHRDRLDGNAPGHGHEIPGVWDSDNGELAGKPCAWCAVWKKAKELCSENHTEQPLEMVETKVPAIVFYPAGSLGEYVESEGGES